MRGGRRPGGGVRGRGPYPRTIYPPPHESMGSPGLHALLGVFFTALSLMCLAGVLVVRSLALLYEVLLWGGMGVAFLAHGLRWNTVLRLCERIHDEGTDVEAEIVNRYRNDRNPAEAAAGRMLGDLYELELRYEVNGAPVRSRSQVSAEVFQMAEGRSTLTVRVMESRPRAWIVVRAPGL